MNRIVSRNKHLFLLTNWILLVFFLVSLSHLPVQTRQNQHKQLTFSLGHQLPVILRDVHGDFYGSQFTKHTFDWSFDEFIQENSPVYTLRLAIFAVNHFERNPFYTFNTASAP